ncbi:hypothetical protein [Draconibacterium halophilum]|uniref:Glycosyltransferase family 1 protein n=1 Tax=Draconibacterium halophilum TaxID=2706887 RepID=A0A6C0RDQ5_9BACT|nr:hypothetical protein [Draconibacterium halophilum]QIA08249.1 hypothetical protein G0Q07_11225 [Draconibacterium halophilum]
MRLSKSAKIYIACKPQAATGGPELLHQLVAKLNQSGLNARMFYLKKMDDPIHSNYKKYVNEYVFEIEDHSDNVLIVPETRTFELNKYKSIQKIIWWQSVDNYYASRNRFKNRLLAALGLRKAFNVENPKDNIAITDHLVQSKYAELHLNKYGIGNWNYLTDYIREDFITKSNKLSITEKENIVLYNPRKGKKFTQKIIDTHPEIKWVPLKNLTPAEVADRIASAKVYIDFGNHPGRDRFPREAAVLYNCVITGRRGAAKNGIDIPIDNEFKFEDDVQLIKQIGNKIKECIENYEVKVKQFESYRTLIKNQEENFEEEIRAFFSK